MMKPNTAAKLMITMMTALVPIAGQMSFGSCEKDGFEEVPRFRETSKLSSVLDIGALNQYEHAALPVELIEHKTYGLPTNPALVLVPGIGSDLRWTSTLLDDLSKSFFVIAYSQRGHGNTPAVGKFHSSLLAKDIVALLDHYGIAKTYVYGFSMGVRTATRFASEYLDRVNGLFMGDMHLKKITHGKAYQNGVALEELLSQLPASFENIQQLHNLRETLTPKVNSLALNIYPARDGRYRFGLGLYSFQALSEDLGPAIQIVHKAQIPIVAFHGTGGGVLSGVGIDHLLKNAPSVKLLEQHGAGHGVNFGYFEKELGREINKVHHQQRYQNALKQGNFDVFDNEPLPLELVDYKIIGKKGAPTVLFIHGLGGSLESWERGAPQLLNELGEKYQLLLYSLRGHKGTAAVGKNYSLEILAADAAALLRHMNIPRAHVIGHSLGARVGAQLAADHPEVVQSFLAEDMHFKGVKHAKSLAQLMSDTELLLAMPASFADKNELLAAIPEGMSQSRRWQLQNDDNLYFGKDGRIRLQGWQYLESKIGDEMGEVLKRIRAPMRFLAADPQWMDADSGQPSAFLRGPGIEHIKQNLPDAKVIQFYNSGHGIHYHQPEGYLVQALELFAEAEQKNKGPESSFDFWFRFVGDFFD